MRAMRKLGSIVAGLLLLVGVLAPAGAQAAATPAWSLTLTPMPSNFAPAANPQPEYLVVATNIGAKPTSGSSIVTLTLPAGLTPTEAKANTAGTTDVPCTISGEEVACQTPLTIDPGLLIFAAVKVSVGATEGTLDAVASASGGGAANEARATAATPIQANPVPFGFLPGFASPYTGEAGEATTLAGSHPYQQTVSFNFPTEIRGEELVNDGHPRDSWAQLSQGWVGDPAATPVLCTEVELEIEGCPPESQVGIFEVTTAFGRGTNGIASSGLFNMVPPHGTVAELGSNIGNLGLFVHLRASVRTEGDYGVTVIAPDIIGFPTIPIFGAQVQIWGDPSAPAHNAARECPPGVPTCVSDGKTAFLTTPASCPGAPLGYEVQADFWEEPFPAFEKQTARYQSSDLEGNPVSMSGCAQLPYGPTISAQPTTNQADSPSGLEFSLHQPQDMRIGERAGGELRDARVTLPAGMAVNPSQAAGLDVCTESQIGYLGEGHYSAQPQSCPDAAKLGTVEVTSPLIAETEEEGTKVATDPETGQAIARPLKGSVYLAKPFDNQFGSLLAIYLAVEDPRTGIVSKLAGRVEADPQSGRLTTVFEDNPELPLEEIKLSLSGGARGSLITPLTCGSHTTTTSLTPWSAAEAGIPIEGAIAHPESSFQTTGEPGGGPCPTSEAGAPNSPTVGAGTESPQAGAYSPFVLKLSRPDGSQRLTGIDTLLPEGLTGRLAGIPECGAGQIAQAEGRSHPEEGILEQRSPSCPAASALGTVTVAAGAGPTPYYTEGRAYLAGPYKGAPLSLAVITPAIAGPFDLGTVVTRVALRVEPETTRIHAVSDPLPTILDGIPLDIRSVSLRMGRPGFTLNPTSCEPMAITGQATSSLGQAASFSQRFQVGGCAALPFRPKLSLRLKGKVRRTAHPRLIATLRAREGEANIARAQVKLPHAVFLDQGHIRTVCTRVQWTADTCPAGSVYGRAEATTPLLGYPISGSVYLRSSSHKLPDLVVKLRGPASQPIEIDLDGRTDSVKGALRNTFEAVPDAPVSTFRLELFGGRRGLVEMSSGFCRSRRATVHLTGHNGKVHDTRPAVAAKCPKHRRHGKRHATHGHHGKRHGSGHGPAGKGRADRARRD